MDRKPAHGGNADPAVVGAVAVHRTCLSDRCALRLPDGLWLVQVPGPRARRFTAPLPIWKTAWKAVMANTGPMYHDHRGMTEALAIPDRRKRSRAPMRVARRPDSRIHLLEQPVDLVRPEEMLAEVETWVEAGQKALVANHNLHSMHLVRMDDSMVQFFARADLIQIDSKPLIWLARARGLSASSIHRSTYLDWRSHFWSLANRKGWRVFYVGGADGVAAKAAARLAERYPRMVIGTHGGYFDATPGSDENAAVIDQIRDFAPDILLVGMGMPRQEAWITRNFDDLPDAVIFNVGAAFDYEAGVQKAAPRWTGQLGLEWLYRLANDPGRLFHRYCIEPWRLAGPIWRDLRRGRTA